MNVSDELLTAYADGELDERQRAAIDAALVQDASLAARVAQLRSLRTRLQSVYEPILEEPVPPRLLALLQTSGAGERKAQMLPFEPRAVKTITPHVSASRRWVYGSALAASILVGFMAGVLATRGSNRAQLELVAGVMVARGALAKALNSQLAATQSATAAVRMNISYRDRAGNYCRVFSGRPGAGLAGVACRRGNDWQLQELAAGPGDGGNTGAYRQASSEIPTAVLTFVQSQIKGDPLDAEAEARAASSGWRKSSP